MLTAKSSALSLTQFIEDMYLYYLRLHLSDCLKNRSLLGRSINVNAKLITLIKLNDATKFMTYESFHHLEVSASPLAEKVTVNTTVLCEMNWVELPKLLVWPCLKIDTSLQWGHLFLFNAGKLSVFKSL